MAWLVLFVLPAVIVVTWIGLWWRGSQGVRLWFAALSVVGVVLTCALGMYLLRYDSEPMPYGDGGAYWARSMSTISEETVLVGGNAILGLIVAVPLAVISAIADLARSRPPSPQREEAADALEQWGRDNGYL
ncbi:hypothetical protein [Paractinoplanes lichenicola]|uniref:Uncharacterized protein n=1 Tax=Paractinoplanes lichenicola TaxID=2802976 RepID=A0ABS1W3U7_9ACTN|nr:hypothetical protein [Actinoplanes lichenicola]MBL7261411.1 hypothetical protein [Actinoplanes lichenicola]